MNYIGGLNSNDQFYQDVRVNPPHDRMLTIFDSIASLVTSNWSGTPNFSTMLEILPETPDISNLTRELELGTINIYVLGYNNTKQLVGNPNTITTLTNDNLPLTLMSNIKKYLENFKLMTDVVTLNDGYIVNFGVMFDVIAEKYANKQEVKLKCIQKIKDYFNINKMQFNQPIFKSQLEYELMGVEGVRSIGHVTITQDYDYFYPQDSGDGESLTSPTYTYSFTQDTGIDTDGDDNPNSGYIVASGGTTGYGYKYDFATSVSDDKTIILPPQSSTPTVFELKNPNQNIQGRVR
jgi:hypothetical protein